MFEILTIPFLLALIQITIIDILLGADNAILIALACRNLDVHQKKIGILYGSIAAIGLRVILIFFAVFLLSIPFLKIIGGFFLIKIAIDLLNKDKEIKNISAKTKLFSAVKTIVIADFLMSLDNVIGIASIVNNSKVNHSNILIFLGILISVPIIMYGSTLVLKLIDKFPFIVYLGAALLGWIGGEIIVTDIFILPFVNKLLEYLNFSWLNFEFFKILIASISALFVFCTAFVFKNKKNTNY